MIYICVCLVIVLISSLDLKKLCLFFFNKKTSLFTFGLVAFRLKPQTGSPHYQFHVLWISALIDLHFQTLLETVFFWGGRPWGSGSRVVVGGVSLSFGQMCVFFFIGGVKKGLNASLRIQWMVARRSVPIGMVPGR